MRPDRIILGEIRGTEAIDTLNAMNTGHEGSLATVHSNSTRDALARMETMSGMGMPNLTDKNIREMMARAIDIIIQVDRLPDGSRRVLAITEVTGMEGSVITTQDLFAFKQQGYDDDGRIRGTFVATGVRPKCMGRLRQNGVEIPRSHFAWRMPV